MIKLLDSRTSYPSWELSLRLGRIFLLEKTREEVNDSFSITSVESLWLLFLLSLLLIRVDTVSLSLIRIWVLWGLETLEGVLVEERPGSRVVDRSSCIFGIVVQRHLILKSEQHFMFVVEIC